MKDFRSRCIEIVRLLLSDEVTNKFGKVDIHIYNEVCVSLGINNGHIEIVKLLLSDEITNKFGKSRYSFR